MDTNTKPFGEMTDAEADALWIELGDAIACDDGAAAKEHLAAGFPIYYREENTPKGLVIKQYPDGRRELVHFDESGERVARSAA